MVSSMREKLGVHVTLYLFDLPHLIDRETPVTVGAGDQRPHHLLCHLPQRIQGLALMFQMADVHFGEAGA